MNLSSCLKRSALAAVAVALLAGPALGSPSIVIDVSSGDTLYQQESTRPWFPASLSKLMTVFVALKAEREGRITLNTPMSVSARAASMAPSKMGFRPGTLVTLDNALKMLMVKSANDIAITIAEGVSGSVEGFAAEMNAAAASIGMRESHFVNPNGLPDARQISSARDMAVLGRALYAYFPDHADLFDIGALRLGKRIIPTHNGMLGRYPGADGMKTGFTCSAGFNLVASATQNGRRLIVVVLGAPSAPTRTTLAASLLDRAFAGQFPRSGSALALASTGGEPPDLRDNVCRNRGKAIAEFNAEIEDMSKPIGSAPPSARSAEGQSAFGSPAAQAAPLLASQIATLPRPAFDPLPVFVGPPPGWTGPIARATGDTTPIAAYSAEKDEEADAPLKPAADAQSMRRKSSHAKHAVRHATTKHGAAKAAKAAPEAVKTASAHAEPAKPKAAPAKAKPEKAAKAGKKVAHAAKAKSAAAKPDAKSDE
jgi:D-alanyl-D-alanine carboxypeptidase